MNMKHRVQMSVLVTTNISGRANSYMGVTRDIMQWLPLCSRLLQAHPYLLILETLLIS